LHLSLVILLLNHRMNQQWRRNGNRLDVSLPLNGSINRASPAWTTSLLNEYIRTIDAFSQYDNLLAFNIGNEVINLPVNTDAGRESDFSPTAAFVDVRRGFDADCWRGSCLLL
jgi:hypothetical protein